MTYARLRCMERKHQTPQGAAQVARLLRQEMKARGLTAKELSRAIDDETPWTIDYRTIQHVAAGNACVLDSFLILCSYFGWDWAETAITPAMGVDPLTARERELASRLAAAAALHSRVERERTLRSDSAPAASGLHVVGGADRVSAASLGGGA